MRSVVLLLAVTLIACAASPTGRPSSDLNKVSIGMDKQTVIASLGSPSRVSANTTAEFLIYLLTDDVDYAQSAASLGLLPPAERKSEYFVRIVDGRVDSFGRIGDFGTAIPKGNAP